MAQDKLDSMPVKTYLFGAGASVHAGYPLASRMGEAFLMWLQSEPDTSFIDAYERNFIDVDFEQALNKMAAIMTKTNLSSSEIEDKMAFVEFRSRMRQWFEYLGTNSASAYASFAENIAEPGDFFVSFNYDICLEDALKHAGKWEVKDGYAFQVPGFERPSSTKLIKLHGSINWTIPVGVQTNRPVIGSKDCRTLGYADGTDGIIREPFYEAGPLLAVPTSEKKFYVSTSFGPRFKMFWDYLWTLSGQRLRSSNEVIICGYSLPLADKRARDTIFSSIDKTARIEIVCGSSGPDIAGQFMNQGFLNVTVAAASRFEEWVASKLEGEQQR